MKKILLFFILFGISRVDLSATLLTGSEAYIEFQIQSRKELAQLTRIMSIARVDGNVVIANVNQKELDEFEQLGYAYRFLPPHSLVSPAMTDDPAWMRDWDFYPTYEVYVEMMYAYAQDYPDICQIFNIGYSVEGRELLFVKISDNVNQDENEPEFMYTAQMHGDELVTYILMLRLIHHLLENYGINPVISNLVDNIEIWINPLANPDGTYAGGNNTVNGAQRRNANNVDLNRNFPDMLDGDHPDGNPWQPETIAMMDLAVAHHFVLSANLHSGAEVVNYPWDRIQQRHADNDWWQEVSRTYADTVHENAPPGYMDGFDNGITNGWDWYSINGGRQDYMNYFYHCRELTLELSDVKMLPASQLPAHWDYNRESFLLYMEECLFGLRGLITDQGSLPLQAEIFIPEHDNNNSQVYSDPLLGNYHRMLFEGNYDLEIFAYGFIDQTFTNIAIFDDQISYLDVILQPAALVTVTGQVTAIDNNEPVSEATIAFLDTPLDPAVTDNDGYYQLAGVAVNDYQVRISARHFIPQFCEVEVTEEQTVFNFEIKHSYTEDFESTVLPDYLTSSGNQQWYIDTGNAHSGYYSARSGDIGNSQSTSLLVSLSVTEESFISFFRQVSCENDDNDNYDYLQFIIDGTEQARWDGEISWGEEFFPVPAGEHLLEWRYRKDNSVSTGQDCAWLDYITFPPSLQFIPILTVSVDSIYTEITPVQGIDLAFTISNEGNCDLEYSADIMAEWIDPDPLTGYLSTGEQQPVNFILESPGLTPGIYYADIVIEYGAFATVSEIIIPWTLQVTDTANGSSATPLLTRLIGNYPNPFNPETSILFELQHEGHVLCSIYNLRGELVKVLGSEVLPASSHALTWNGRDSQGRKVPSGIYFYRLVSDNYSASRKMIMIK